MNGGDSVNNAQGIYVTKLAERARHLCEEKGVIRNDTFIITQDEIERVINYFKGIIEKKQQDELIAMCNNENVICFMQKAKKGENIQFAIYYCGELNVMNILHELGHVFLDLNTMQSDGICCYRDVSCGMNEIAASKFARAFIMPTELFKQAVLENFENGFCDVDKVAKKFGVETTQVISRGREIFLWE